MCVDEAASPPLVVVTDTTEGVLHVLEPASLDAAAPAFGRRRPDAFFRTIHHSRKASNRA